MNKGWLRYGRQKWPIAWAGLVLVLLLSCEPQQQQHHFKQLNQLDSLGKIKVSYTLKPIGLFLTPFGPTTGAPAQGRLNPDNKGRIEIFAPYAEGLQGIEQYPFIMVVYLFDRLTEWSLTTRPKGSVHYTGVFATRSPMRPGAIGVSVVKLDAVKGNTLYVSGVDAYNQTPILDIKPYLPSVDCIDPAELQAIEAERSQPVNVNGLYNEK